MLFLRNAAHICSSSFLALAMVSNVVANDEPYSVSPFVEFGIGANAEASQREMSGFNFATSSRPSYLANVGAGVRIDNFNDDFALSLGVFLQQQDLDVHQLNSLTGGGSLSLDGRHRATSVSARVGIDGILSPDHSLGWRVGAGLGVANQQYDVNHLSTTVFSGEAFTAFGLLNVGVTSQLAENTTGFVDIQATWHDGFTVTSQTSLTSPLAATWHYGVSAGIRQTFN